MVVLAGGVGVGDGVNVAGGDEDLVAIGVDGGLGAPDWKGKKSASPMQLKKENLRNLVERSQGIKSSSGDDKEA